MKAKFGYLNSLLLVAAALVLGTTTIASGNSTSQVWGDVIEGTEGDDEIVGTPEDDQIDSKGGDDENIGDAVFGGGSGDDVIVSGGDDGNRGDSSVGDGSGDDVIASGEGNDFNTGHGGRDVFVCGGQEDTVTDYNEEEGDIAAQDCENV